MLNIEDGKREPASLERLLDLTAGDMKRVNELILSRAGSDVVPHGETTLALATPLSADVPLRNTMISTTLPLSCSCIAMWVIVVAGVAPCQCFTPAGIQTTSPLRIS